MSRELAYVALTRGRKENHAFIATDIADLGYDGAPAPEQTGRQILEQILATTSTETSATETLRALQDDATSLAQLAPIHETLVQAAQRQRWTTVIAGCGFTDEQTAQVLNSPAYGALVAALRRAEHDGHPMHRVLPALAAAAPLAIRDNEEGNEASDGAQPARDIAAVLHHRVTTWHDHTGPAQGRQPQLIGGIITPAGDLGDAPTDQVDAVHQLETLMTNRVDALVRQALQRPPAWLRALGPPPTDPRRRASWTEAVTVIAAYRDRYTVPEHGHPLGSPDIADPDQGLARRRAHAAARQARGTAIPRRRTAATSAPGSHPTPSL